MYFFEPQQPPPSPTEQQPQQLFSAAGNRKESAEEAETPPPSIADFGGFSDNDGTSSPPAKRLRIDSSGGPVTPPGGLIDISSSPSPSRKDNGEEDSGEFPFDEEEVQIIRQERVTPVCEVRDDSTDSEEEESGSPPTTAHCRQDILDLLGGCRSEEESKFVAFAERDFDPSEVPKSASLFSEWPVCALLHTWIDETSELDACLRRQHLLPETRLRLLTSVDEETLDVEAKLVSLNPALDGYISAGVFPPVASSILDSLCTQPLAFRTTYRLGEKATSRPTDILQLPSAAAVGAPAVGAAAVGAPAVGAAVSSNSRSDSRSTSSGRVPLTVLIHCPIDSAGALLYPLVLERLWATYVRRHYLANKKSLLHAAVNVHNLSRDTVCTNLYAKDCLFTILTSRETPKSPNIDCVFRADRRIMRLGQQGSDFSPEPGQFGHSALPRGRDTFPLYEREMLNLFELGESGSVHRVSSRAVLEPPAGTGEQDDHLEFSDSPPPPPPEEEEFPTSLPEQLRKWLGLRGDRQSIEEEVELLAASSASSFCSSAGLLQQEDVMRGTTSCEQIDSRLAKGLNDLFSRKEWDSMPEIESNVQYLNCELLAHQRKGVKWMQDIEEQSKVNVAQELRKHESWHIWTLPYPNSDWAQCLIPEVGGVELSKLRAPRGGILADEMGLGKTIETLALILTDPVSQLLLDDWSAMNKKSKLFCGNAVAAGAGNGNDILTGGNLIICPKSVLTSWKAQIEQHTAIPIDLVAVLHSGSEKRKWTQKELAAKLIVLTTYQQVPLGKVNNAIHKIKWRRVVLDEAHTIRSLKSRMTQQCLAIDSVYKWCLTGTPVQNRLKDLAPLMTFLDVHPFNDEKTFMLVINRLESSLQSSGKGNNNPTPKMVENARTTLQAALQWILLRRKKSVVFPEQPNRKEEEEEEETGTAEGTGNQEGTDTGNDSREDSQSKLLSSELSSEVSSNRLGRSSSAVTKGGRESSSSSSFPLQSSSDRNFGESLPRKTIEIWSIPLSFEERQRYGCLADLGRDAAKHLGREDMAKLWTVITHLRLLANTEAIVTPSISHLIDELMKRQGGDNSDLVAELIGSRQMDDLIQNQCDLCPVCLDLGCDVITPCRHCFHEDCISTWIKTSTPCCPTCRKPLQIRQLLRRNEAQAMIKNRTGTAAKRKLPAKDDYDFDDCQEETANATDRYQESSKVRHICDRIVQQIRLKRLDKKPTKVVAFSTFVKLLNHIKAALERRGVSCVVFDGSLSVKKREQIVRSFQCETQPLVMLASIKAAGTGLTLTAANIAYIIDPWWNPHVEDQAIDRLHRIGQTRDVQIYRVVSKGTVEEAVIEKQKDKRILAEAALSEHGTSLKNLHSGGLETIRDVLLNPNFPQP